MNKVRINPVFSATLNEEKKNINEKQLPPMT